MAGSQGPTQRHPCRLEGRVKRLALDMTGQRLTDPRQTDLPSVLTSTLEGSH